MSKDVSIKETIKGYNTYNKYVVEANDIAIESVDNVLATSKRIVVSSTLVPVNISTRKITSDYDNIDNLARMITSKEDRDKVQQILDKSNELSNLIKKIVSSGNGSVKIGSIVTDYSIILREVSTQYSEHNNKVKTFITSLLYRFLSELGLVSTDRTYATVNVIDSSNITVDLIKSDIVYDACKRLIRNNISFPSIAKIDGVTNCQLLASIFTKDLEQFVIKMLNVNKVGRAIDSVLPRIYAYIKGEVNNRYVVKGKNNVISEAEFINDSNFISLAQNIEMIKLALNSKGVRFSDNPHYWAEYDQLLLESLKQSETFAFRTIDHVVSEYNIDIIRSQKGYRKSVLLSKNIDAKVNPQIYHKTSINGFLRFTAYPELDAFATGYKGFADSFENNISHMMAEKNLSRYVEEDAETSVLISSINIENDLERLAISLSDDVYVDSENNLIFGVHSVQNDLNREFKGLPKSFFTKQAHHIVFVRSDKVASTSALEINLKLPIDNRSRFGSVESYLSSLTELKADIVFRSSINSKEVTIKSDEGLSEFLALDISDNIVIDNVFNESIKVENFIGCYTSINRLVEGMMYSSETLDDNDEIKISRGKQVDNVKRAIARDYGRDLYNRYVSFSSNYLVDALVSKMSYIIFENYKQKGETADNFFYNEFVQANIKVTTVNYLLVSIGVISKEQAELISKLINQYLDVAL